MHVAMGCSQTIVVVPPAAVQFPIQMPLAPGPTSVTSVANYKGDNQMIPGVVHRPLRRPRRRWEGIIRMDLQEN